MTATGSASAIVAAAAPPETASLLLIGAGLLVASMFARGRARRN
jgi:hypothetical protein